MTAPVWAPGSLYQPGAIVQPRSTSQVTQTPPTNAGFETGLTAWDQSFENGTGTWTSVISPPPATGAFAGTKVVEFAADPGGTGTKGSVTGILKNTFLAPVTPGQAINFSVRVARNASPRASSWSNGGARIYWLDASEVEISFSIATTDGVTGTPAGMTGGDDGGVAWKLNSGRAVAPAGAAFARFAVVGTDNTAGGSGIWFDACSWDYTFQGQPTGLVFKAVQAAAGTSGAAEPVWPIVNGLTVVDNEVTWEALYASRVVWEAAPILVSGATEPAFPAAANAAIADGSIAWVAMDNRVKDSKCPQSKVVAIAASKVFAGDNDIVAYCATVNPLDWSTEGDAGYLPFGLQTYGATPVAALGLYRSNLVAFNSKGYQMWQVDEDPANMALLDASPADCTDHQSVQPVSNDLAFLTSEGVRSIGIAGASTNLQAGYFGKAVDPLVKALRALGFTPRGLFWPGAGQYWLFFGAQAVVLTMNGEAEDQSWSRYVFPATVTAWTIHDSKLYLRAGALVWEVSEDAGCVDDKQVDVPTGGTNTTFDGYIAWPYLDFGALGTDKELEGIDIVCTGTVTLAVGHNQKDSTKATAGYVISGDTLPEEGMIPFPLTAPSMQFRLTFSYAVPWEWEALNVYLT